MLWIMQENYLFIYANQDTLSETNRLTLNERWKNSINNIPDEYLEKDDNSIQMGSED